MIFLWTDIVFLMLLYVKLHCLGVILNCDKEDDLNCTGLQSPRWKNVLNVVILVWFFTLDFCLKLLYILADVLLETQNDDVHLNCFLISKFLFVEKNACNFIFIYQCSFVFPFCYAYLGQAGSLLRFFFPCCIETKMILILRVPCYMSHITFDGEVISWMWFPASISHKKYASLSTKVACLMHKGLTSIIQRWVLKSIDL